MKTNLVFALVLATADLGWSATLEEILSYRTIGELASSPDGSRVAFAVLLDNDLVQEPFRFVALFENGGPRTQLRARAGVGQETPETAIARKPAIYDLRLGASDAEEVRAAPEVDVPVDDDG